MGKFAVKIERVITIALILSMMLILIPGVSVQAKAKKCNHKSVTWITTSKSSCTDEGIFSICVRNRCPDFFIFFIFKIFPQFLHFLTFMPSYVQLDFDFLIHVTLL